MKALNVKEEIRKLIELQEIDSNIFALTREKAEQPKILEELQKEFDSFRARLKNLEDEKRKLQLGQKEQEIELAAKEENIKKSQNQLAQLKTNKDYQLKLAEIESLRADKSIIEEDVLKKMEEIDIITKNIEEEKKLLQEAEQQYNEKKSALAQRLREIESLLNGSEGKRKILADSIDKKFLGQYEHILHGKNGMAIVKIQENSCQGCFMKMPPQVINEIKMHEHIVTCEMCSRILYLEEDV